MHRLSQILSAGICLSDCYLLVLVFRFVIYPVLSDEIAIFCIQYWDNEVFLQTKFFSKS